MKPLDEMQTFRAQELLLARATEGLTEREAAELAALGVEHDTSFDLAAAAIDLAALPVEPMPAGLADRLLAAALPASAAPSTLAGEMPITPPRDAPIAITRRRSRGTIIAWTCAAIAIAAAAGVVLWARQEQKPEVVVRLPVTPPPAEARAALLAKGDSVTLAWSATADPAARGASGDVVWSAAKQEGYLRFVGLAANDPAKTQYQLWIFDKARDQQFPVDGGVFDVGPDGEVIVKIAPKLRVGEPVLFAVTVEVPGGVVVSKRERIVVTAAPKA